MLREHIPARRLCFTDGQRRRLAVKAKTLGRRTLGELETLVTPDTLRRVGLPQRITRWSLMSLQLVKTGGQLVKHARDYWLLLAEGHLHRRLFSDMLRRLWALPLPAG